MLTLTPEQRCVLALSAAAERLRLELRGPSDEVNVDSPNRRIAVKRGASVAQLLFSREGKISGLVSPEGRRWDFVTNDLGQIVELRMPSGLATGASYQANGNPNRITRNGTEICRISFDPESKTAIASHPDRTTREVTLAADRLSRIKDRLGNTEGYQYGPTGELAAVSDGAGHTHRFDYDSSLRLQRLAYPDGSFESYRYANREITITRPSGDDLMLDLDDGGGIRAVRGKNLDIRFEQSDANLKSAALNGRGIEFAYDAQGRVVEERTDAGSLRYEYAPCGRVGRVTHPSGDSVEFSYDADRRLAQAIDWNGGVHRFAYSSDDRRVSIQLPNGAICDIGLSQTGRLSTSALRGHALNYAELNWGFEYDEEERLIRFRTGDEAVGSYVYDAEGHLTQFTARGFSHSFEYDAAGNRTRAAGEVASFNELNQLVSQGNKRCEYDARGNLVALLEGARSWNFEYDLRDQLTRAVAPDGRQTTYGYDAFGRRIAKRSSDREIRYVWAGEQLIEERITAGNITECREYMYIPDTLIPFAMRIDGAVHCIHTDQIGTVRAITDSDGNVVWNAEYSAFGMASASGSRITNALRLPGHYFDGETGLHYNRFRYYSPDLGRYLSRDPIGLPGGLNLYAYVNNDPVNAVDPLGLWSWAAVAAGVVTAIVVVALAPLTGPLLVLAAGAAAGAAFYSVNEAVTNPKATVGSVLVQGVKGAVVGAVASIPFMLAMPAGAGYIMTAGAGLVSGELGYAADWVVNGCHAKDWNSEDFMLAALAGAILAPVAVAVGRGIGKAFGKTPPRSSAGAGTGSAQRVQAAVEGCGEPSGVNPSSNRPSEMPYHHPPEMLEAPPGESLDLNRLDPSQKYLWAVGEDGTVRVAPEKQTGFGANDQFPNGRDVKHGDLFPGPEGQSRGAARIGGELDPILNPDQSPTGEWVMNNDSSYTFNRADGAVGSQENLTAAHDLLTESGTDTSRLVPVNTSGQQ